jgi:tetratricopeptide (TPR) repeat protein
VAPKRSPGRAGAEYPPPIGVLAGMPRLADEAFARAALQSGCRFSAGLAEARALMATGRPEPAEHLLATLTAPDDRASITLALLRARNLFWALGRPAHAEMVLCEAATTSDAAELHALRARFAFAQGDPCGALAIATPIEACVGAPGAARVRAAVAMAEALAVCGRRDEALAVARRWEHAAVCQLAGAQALAHWLAGSLPAATAEAERSYALAAAAQDSAGAALLLGHVWLSRGRVETALRWFRESSVLLRGADPAGMRPATLAAIAQAAAQAGDAARAHAAIEALDGIPRSISGEIGLAHAWTAKVSGDSQRAIALATDVATDAESRGAHGFAVRAHHELARLTP